MNRRSTKAELDGILLLASKEKLFGPPLTFLYWQRQWCYVMIYQLIDNSCQRFRSHTSYLTVIFKN